MKDIIVLSLSFLFLVTPLQAQETVYCLHGFMRTSSSMKKMANAFEEKGYSVHNWGYPSRSKTIEEHAKALLQDVQNTAKEHPSDPIHFVTHSMGGVIVRALHNLPDCPEEVKIGKAVLLSPPNQGTRFGRFLGKSRLIRIAFGLAAGRELLSYKDFDFLGQFPKEKDVLIISGTCGWNPIIGERSDGKVGVKEACLTTPHAHKTLFATHTWIMYSTSVIREAVEFIDGAER